MQCLMQYSSCTAVCPQVSVFDTTRNKKQESWKLLDPYKHTKNQLLASPLSPRPCLPSATVPLVEAFSLEEPVHLEPQTTPQEECLRLELEEHLLPTPLETPPSHPSQDQHSRLGQRKPSPPLLLDSQRLLGARSRKRCGASRNMGNKLRRRLRPREQRSPPGPPPAPAAPSARSSTASLGTRATRAPWSSSVCCSHWPWHLLQVLPGQL